MSSLPHPPFHPVSVEVVAEGGAVGPTSWPVPPQSHPAGWLAVHGGLSRDETGLFVARWAQYAIDTSQSPTAVARALIADDDHTVFGGLRFTDTLTGAVVLPGCCSGIEDWRTLAWGATGEEPDLGHNGPWAEQHPGWLQLWPAGNEDWRSELVREGLPVAIRHADIPDLLEAVQRDLVGLLERLAEWGSEYCPQEAGGLVEVADQAFAIRAGLR